MGQFKKIVPIFISVLLLCFLVAMPPVFTKIKEKALINRMIIEEIPENVSDASLKQDLTAADKVELIAKGREEEMNIKFVSGWISDSGNINSIKEKVCLELKKLVEMKAIMNVDISDCELLSVNTFNCVDMDDMSRSVAVILLELDFSSISANIMMDIETSHIYGYILHRKVYVAGGEESEDSQYITECTSEEIAPEEVEALIHSFQVYSGLSPEEFENLYDPSQMPWTIWVK